MKRLADYFLTEWKKDEHRMPLLLRGARQVGKTFAVRQLAKTYDNFIEINFELQPAMRFLFDQDLHPQRIINELAIATKQKIIPGKTLLFFDEVQLAPQGIIALRYFYEMMPELHVIAAGSLLDFAIEEIGIPVGRVACLYMHPLSFIEYLAAMNEPLSIQKILEHTIDDQISPILHQQFLYAITQYLVFGGMPGAIQKWITSQNALLCTRMHTSILDSYEQDFGKYARKNQIKYVQLIFNQIPQQIGGKFKYSLVDGDYRKRELAPALDLLETAGIAHKVFYSAGQEIPLGAQIDPLDYKVIFIDTGLAQTSLGLDMAGWFLQTEQEFINKGAIVEAFVGQELVAYSSPYKKNHLYYWHKDSAPHQAEIDYLVQIDQKVIPIEVKSGSGRTLKSMQYFLETHKNSPYGLKFSTQNYSRFNQIHSYPLYAIAKIMNDNNIDIQAAIKYLVTTHLC